MSLSLDSNIAVNMVAPSPLCGVLPYLFLLYYFHSSSLIFPFLVSVFPPLSFCSNASGCICLCVCHLSFSLCLSSPSLSQTVDWYGDTRLRVFLALPQMGPWQHVRDQNVLYLSCQAVPRDQNGSRPFGAGGGGAFSHPFSLTHFEVLIVSFGMAKDLLLLKGANGRWWKEMLAVAVSAPLSELYPNLWSSGGEIADHTSAEKKIYRESKLHERTYHGRYQYILPGHKKETYHILLQEEDTSNNYMWWNNSSVLCCVQTGS